MQILKKCGIFLLRVLVSFSFLVGAIIAGIFAGANYGFRVGKMTLNGWHSNMQMPKYARVIAMLLVFFSIACGCRLISRVHQMSLATVEIQKAKEPEEPRGIVKILPKFTPQHLTFSKEEREALVARYGANSLEGVLFVIAAGHGAIAPKTRYGLDVGTHWVFDGEEYWEAAYTYRMARELGELAEALGATVVYANEAPSMDQVTGPKDPLPLPKNATLYGGQPMYKAQNTFHRADAATKALRDYPECQLALFAELHVNAIGSPGWSGLCVYYPRKNKSQYATAVEQAIIDQHYDRKRFGNPKISAIATTFDCINGNHNAIINRILLECGVPNSDEDIKKDARDPRWNGLSDDSQRRLLGGDNWRLRNPENRRLMLERVLIAPAVKLNKGGA